MKRLATVLLLMLVGCSHGGSSGAPLSQARPPATTPPPRPAPSTPPAPATSSSTARIFTRTFVPDSALIKAVDTPQGSSWNVERAFPGFHFTRPVFLANAGDGSGRVFVVELKGTVWSLSGTAPVVSSLFLDISSRVHYGTEEGLWSIAFHPGFKTNGLVFAVYSTGTTYQQGAPDQVRVRLSRFSLSASNPGQLDPASEVVLLEIPKRYSNHNGGTIAFGPDGYLYMSVGDGGCCGDPERNAQNLNALKGKILRLDVDQGSPYATPPDNPFAGQANARAEVWAYGLRNPWRFSFDRANGTLWAGDVGQDTWEEVDVVTKGGNYGWSAFEGDHVYDASIPAPGSIAPALEFDHTVGQCVIGGYVYRGASIPSLQGQYLFADYATGKVWAASWDGIRVTGILPVTNSIAPSVCSFGEDEAGEVYLLSYSTGCVYKVAAAPPPVSFPQTLSATGLFSDLPTQTLRPETIPYGVVEPLWSDNAIKSRHMLLPHLDQAQWTSAGGFVLPADAILVKNFWLERTLGDPTTKQIVETRLLINTQGDWRGYTYEWNDLGTDATLLADSKHKSIAVVVSGTPVSQDYYFPARAECLRCHTAAAGYLLGPQSLQLNSTFDYTSLGGYVENQLDALERIGVLSQPLPAPPAQLPRLSAHADPNASLDERARSYLHANCSHCHRPDGGAPVDLDLRYDTPLASTGLVGVAPQAGDLGVTGSLLVDKGNPQSSVLYLRMSWLGSAHMPPLATSIVDQDGAQLIADWITHLP